MSITPAVPATPGPVSEPCERPSAGDEAVALMRHLLKFGYLRAVRLIENGSWSIRVSDTTPVLTLPDTAAALDYAVAVLSLAYGPLDTPKAVA
ncbi:hypothetical protein [Streptacidiphilus fuscans]|uniref:Uncharacterized protein n=1 Tax=Streptacidiphilus fuscans TaxID=2789292 RepID=A0A931BAT1_9ACTN|nr:hypothetical protein [Streptacidiphilus fuscans]MBF9071817.1 hypothetical protein [Streptacidiphilus fuscans]